MRKTKKNEIMVTIIVSGRSETIDKCINDYLKTHRVLKIQVPPQIFKAREEHALAEGNKFIGGPSQQMSDLLWREYNWGIHPASEKDRGFVVTFGIKTTESPVEIAEIVGSWSCQYPELFFDVTCDDPIYNLTTITLLVAGKVVLFSDITNKWSRPSVALRVAQL